MAILYNYKNNNEDFLKNIILVFTLIIFIPGHILFAQGIELKLGTAFYNTYDINNVHNPAPYYYDAKYDINTGLIFSLSGYYPISEKFELVADLRLRNLNGIADSIYVGYSPVDSSKVYKGWEFGFSNVDLIIKGRYLLYNNLSLKVLPFIGVGYSNNLSFDRTFKQDKIALLPADYPIIYIEEASNNNTGFLVSVGFNIIYEFIMIEIGTDLMLYKTHIYEAGNFKLYNINLLFGVHL